jgi:hypothetical protein
MKELLYVQLMPFYMAVKLTIPNLWKEETFWVSESRVLIIFGTNREEGKGGLKPYKPTVSSIYLTTIFQ